MRMLKQKDGSYKLTRLIPPRYTTATVLQGLSPERILELCLWLDALVWEYRLVRTHLNEVITGSDAAEVGGAR